MNYVNKVQGKIIFDPADLTKKHNSQSVWKKHVIAFIDEPDFCNYFSWYIVKRYDLKFAEPIRGVHMTIVNDKLVDGTDATELKYVHSKSVFNKKVISITYNTDVHTDGLNWWFKAKSDEAIKLRQHIGLNPKPYFGFHITIGRVSGREFELEHGKYVHNLIKKYGRW